MTKIHGIFLFPRRIRKNKPNTVPFQSFKSEVSPNKHSVPTKLISSENWNPRIFNKVQGSEQLSDEEEKVKYSNSTLQTIAFFILLFGLVLIVILLYLLFYWSPILNNIGRCGNDKHSCSSNALSRNVINNISIPYSNSEVQYAANKKYKELPAPPNANYSQCQLVEDVDKLDCFPRGKVTKELCESRGCCWIPKDSNVLDTPYCFYSSTSPSYYFLNITETAFGLVAFLKRDYKTAYSKDVEVIQLIVKFETESRLHIKIVDPLEHRYEPPYPEIPIVDKAATNLLYQFVFDVAKPGFKILRKSDNTTIFDSLELRNTIFSEQFLQISGHLPSNFIYGIGHHQSSFKLSMNWTQFTLFNHDGVPDVNKNLYGSHPFYLMIENSSNAHGVFLLNSNAMDILLQPGRIITYRTIGGVLDFFFFLGPTPADVIRQYTDLIGRPYLPPYWGLGFHLCRFGYKTLDRTREIMERNIAAGIPLDTQWNDIDYMNNSNDFTYDKVNFKELPTFIEELHERGMHYIPLVDPGVSASEKSGTYPPYDCGVQMDIFVKNITGQIFVGKVWNKGSTVWPDFTHPNTVDYWTAMLKNLHDSFKFDGAWIDMNEPSNFYSGSVTGCPINDSLEDPPYVPGVEGGFLRYKTMCMSCKHYAGRHYDVHNLYGLTEAIVTNFALAEIRGRRPMIISRATFPGHGRFAGHWSGDVWSTWSDMRYSIPQLLDFSLYGIPLSGADICGFNGNTTAKLCNRWMQLGAFYPFSRNHNTDDGIDQDPVAFGDLVINSSRKALEARYSLLPYLYTLFWDAHIYGDTVARPLFFEFKTDANTYDIDTQFLWGSALMIIPVLEDAADAVTGYLPAGVWYDFYSERSIESKGEFFANISAPLDTIPLFLRGGYVVAKQSAKKTTTEGRKTPVSLVVALDEGGNASGHFYWDDGDSLNSYEEKKYSLIDFGVEDNELLIKMVFGEDLLPPNLEEIRVLGISKTVSTVEVNGGKIDTFKYDPDKKVLNISLSLGFKGDNTIVWK